jgi:autotransporter-associated beta strand protein
LRAPSIRRLGGALLLAIVWLGGLVSVASAQLIPNPLTWTGATNGNWDTAHVNWANTVPVATNYVNGAAVVFANKNPITNALITRTSLTVSPVTGVQPGLVIFSNTGSGNSGVNYTIQDSGNNIGIGGTTLVTVQGAGGQVTFSGDNSYSGATAITAGQLNLADVEAINGTNYSLGLGNSSSLTVASGGTLQLTAASGAAGVFGTGYNGGGLVVGSLTAPIDLTLNGAGQTGGALNSTTGNNTYTGLINIGSGGATIASSGVPANDDGLTLGGTVTVGGGTTLTFAGAGNTTVSSTGSITGGGALVKLGSGTLELDGGLSLGNNSSLGISGGKFRLNINSGSASVGSGVTANITGSAVLELAGSVSALGTTIPANRVAITNSSNATAGRLISAGNQQVGGTGGTGNTQVNAGASLTADHIIQGALIIGGTSGSHALVTIDASDSSGNPLAESNGLALANSLQSSGPFAAGASVSSSLDPPSAGGFNGDPIPAGPSGDGAPVSGNPSAVPEPATLLLALLGLAVSAVHYRVRIPQGI